MKFKLHVNIALSSLRVLVNLFPKLQHYYSKGGLVYEHNVVLRHRWFCGMLF